MTLTSSILTGSVKSRALASGFDHVAIGPASPPDHGPALERWLEAGYAGTMSYLERRLGERLDPDSVLPGARSVVCVALNYFPGEPVPDPSWTPVARYAWGRDYHDVMTAVNKGCTFNLQSGSICEMQGARVLIAWQALIDTAGLKVGQTVLIHGGSGGVGHFAIQIAKARGAKVIATASTPNQDLLKQLGTDQSIDYTKTKFEDVVKDVDVVLEATRSDSMARSYGVVKKGGFVVSITGEPDQAQLDQHGLRGTSIMAHPDANVLNELTKLIEAKKLVPIVSQVFQLTGANKAHQQIETRHTRGKIVLRVAEEDKK